MFLLLKRKQQHKVNNLDSELDFMLGSLYYARMFNQRRSVLSFCKVILFKSINSRGEIDCFLFKDKELFEKVKELLESSYTLTILDFENLSEFDAENFELIEDLDDALIDWHIR